MAAAAAVAATWSVPSHAQARVDARFSVTLAGIQIGRGAWILDVSEDAFTTAASGATSGLMRVIASGQGTGASRGHMVGGSPVPATFAATIVADKKTDEIRMSLAGGNVKDFVYEPPQPPHPERIPVREQHRKGVIDPMTALVFRVPGNASPLSPEACPRNVAIFDGRVRYDLRLAFKRMERVKAEKGYEGPAVVCAVYFVPVAGYIPSRAAIKYLTEQRDMEAWLVPVPGTRLVVPFRVVVPTVLGMGVLQATQFVAMPQRPRAAGARTQ